MRRTWLLAVSIPLALSAAAPVLGQPDTSRTVEDVKLGKHWKLGPSVTIPPLRVQESVRQDAKLDVVLLASVGGGLSFAYVEPHKVVEDGKIVYTDERIFSVSPFTILFSGNTNEDVKNLDLAYAMTVGFFNDLIMVGWGYNFGSNVFQNGSGESVELSRWFLLLGLGVSFNR